MALNLEEKYFAIKQRKWLGHQVTILGITALVRKLDPIKNLNLQVRSRS